MIEVSFLACSILINSPCKQVHLTFIGETITPFECLLYGQGAIAKWTIANPNWIVTRGFKCARAGTYAKA